MEIKAISVMQALEYVVYNRTNVEPFAIISIQEFETNGNGFEFTTTGPCKDVLTLNFSDVDPYIFEKYEKTKELNELISENKCYLFSEKEALLIKNFIEKIKNNNEIKKLIIHCSAGVSRSTAVAAAISKYLYNTDEEFFNNGIPNMHIYNLLLETLTGKPVEMKKEGNRKFV